MPTRDPRIDAYIARQADFARPLLETLRAAVHEACPQAEETIKWGAPAFVHAGALLCTMAAFKQHAAFGLWRQAEILGDAPAEGAGSYGRLATPADLPPREILLAHLRKAAALNEAGRPARRGPAAPRPAPAVPEDLRAALAGDAAARAGFEAFAPSHQREYVDWITDAKRPETRARRIAQALAWLSEGKPRNWKYMGG